MIRTCFAIMFISLTMPQVEGGLKQNINFSEAVYLVITKGKTKFHQKRCSGWPTNAIEIDTINMKPTWPTRAPTRENPTRPIFHQLTSGLMLGDCDSCLVNCDLHWVLGAFQKTRVGIGNANCSRSGPDLKQSPDMSSFTLQWNIG